MNPMHYTLAENEIGIKEIPGGRDNPTIVRYYKDVGHGWVDNDEVAWCAAFVGAMLERDNIPSTGKLNAKSYLKWGRSVADGDKRIGDVLVFDRGNEAWMGHTGFYTGNETDSHIEVLGGNQRNQVSKAWYSKSKLRGIRRAHKIAEPGNFDRKFTPELLRKIAPRGRNDLIQELPALLNKYLPMFKVNTPERIALFLANVMAETGGLKIMEENMSYTAERIRQVWPSRFATIKAARPYARNPRLLANKVYNRYGNRDIQDGGWKYRGRGFMQTTFVDNYRLAERYLREQGFDYDLEADPDQLLEAEPALIAALAFWDAKGLNEYADKNWRTKARKVINGGTHGLTRMQNYYRVILPLVAGLDLDDELVKDAKIGTGTGAGGGAVIGQYDAMTGLVFFGIAVLATAGFVWWKRKKKKDEVATLTQRLPDPDREYDLNSWDDDHLDRTRFGELDVANEPASDSG